jgi:hypothetical protein
MSILHNGTQPPTTKHQREMKSRHSFFEGLGFYELHPRPIFRLDLPTTDTYLIADEHGYLWLEYDENQPVSVRRNGYSSVGFGKFTDEQIKTLVRTMLNCA